jgi:hypothetical protein
VVPTKKRGKGFRGAVQHIASWPHLSAAIITIALFLVASVTFGSFRLLGILTKDLTTTVTVATESLTLSLRENTESSWVLPAGAFLVPEAMKSIETCAEQPLLYGSIPQGFKCNVSESVRLTIDGAADVHWEVTPDGKWSMLIGVDDDTTFTASLFDANDTELLATSDEIRFSTHLDPDQDSSIPAVRLPLIAATAVLGSHVHYASSIDGDTSDFWQPTLLAGSVVTFGKNHPDQGKYHILGEELDAGDVVSIDSAGEAEDESDDVAKDSIWGVATIEDRSVAVSGTTEVSQYLIHAVLHTTHRTLTVRRFGAADGHKITASNWSIMSKWPNGQKTWVFWASVTAVLAFALQLSDWIASKATKSKNKKK